MELKDHPSPNIRWRHRRRMAYVALCGLVGYPALFIFTDSPHLAAVAWPVMSTLGAIVGSYVGFTTWESIKINASG